MPDVNTTTARYLNATDASTLNITATERPTVTHIDSNYVPILGSQGDYIQGHLAPLPSVEVDCDDIILERLWEEKVKPYLDSLILARVTEEELRSVLKLGGDH